MERIELSTGIHYLHGGVNVGLVETERGVVAIDSGLDRSAANRILRAAEELRRPLLAVVNTHAHADHHGGNAQLVRRLDIPVYAPAVEEAVIREPRYEPIYLFGGAAPVSALENRFLQAEPSRVDQVVHAGSRVTIDGCELEVIDLAGHSVAQVGVRAGRVLFAADAFFGLEPLGKHGIPYLVDAGRTRHTLERLLGTVYEWYVPGHGEALREPEATLRANLAVCERVLSWLAERVRREPATTDELLAGLDERFELRIADPTGYVLYRTTLLGYLGTLERAGEVQVRMDGARWLWRGSD
jgi:glyoxylase-like metal-dependent hydrolase (beta-lactamase superfamily II)